MKWRLPFTTFQLGYRKWRIVETPTESAYTRLMIDQGVEQPERREYGCTVEAVDMIYLNTAAHHTYEQYLHTFYHEIKHAVLFSMGFPGDQHNEQQIDGEAALWTQIHLTAGGSSRQRRRRSSRRRSRGSAK